MPPRPLRRRLASIAGDSRDESLVAVQALARMGQWIRRSNRGFHVLDHA
jgi:hypothetical protein